MRMYRKYMWNLLGATSSLINALLGGSMYETICSRLYRNRDKEAIRYLIYTSNILFWWQADHCYWSYLQFKTHTNVMTRKDNHVQDDKD